MRCTGTGYPNKEWRNGTRELEVIKMAEGVRGALVAGRKVLGKGRQD